MSIIRMRTDEQHEAPDRPPETPDGGGLRGRLRNLLFGAAARLRDALGADSLSTEPPETTAAGRSGLPARDGGDPGRGPDAEEVDDGDGPLTVSRADGRLRLSDGDGAYIESDTWEAVER